MKGYDRRSAEVKPYDEKPGESPIVVYTLLGLIVLSIILAFLV